MTPLAERLRPKSLEEVVGQPHLVGPEGWIRRAVRSQKPLSILLWGPPGCGKTTLARLYAQAFDAAFISFSPLFQGVADLKKIIKDHQEHPLFQRRLLLFVDEIHRFNKAQQDAFLPYVENGTVILVGATTENPSFALNNALLSRLRVLVLGPLHSDDLEGLLSRYEVSVKKLPLDDSARAQLIEWAQGDARHLLNMLENLEMVPESEVITLSTLATWVQKRPALYDKADEAHYNLISALHKAVRGSDPDAALYWLARMLEGGEAAAFLIRRLVRMASEDIGLADPQALGITLQAGQAYEQLGSPEGDLALAQAVVYLALAPKSNATYTAWNKVRESARSTTQLSPPPHILNAPTRLMKQLGYGEGYIYDPDTPEGFSGQDYFPEEMERPSFYHPVERGFERELKKRLDYFCRLRHRKQAKKNPSGGPV